MAKILRYGERPGYVFVTHLKTQKVMKELLTKFKFLFVTGLTRISVILLSFHNGINLHIYK